METMNGSTKIKMKFRTLRTGTAILLLLSTLLTASACNGKKREEPEGSTAGVTDGETAEPATEKGVDLLDYAVTYRDRAPAYETENATGLRALLRSIYGKTVTIQSDFYRMESDYDPQSKEILIGATNRVETAEAMSRMRYDQYCILRIGTKIVIHSPSLAGLQKACSKFYNKLLVTYMQTGGAVRIDEEFFGIFTLEGWAPEVPAFENGNYVATVNGNNGTYELVYNRTKAEHFTAYCEKLLANGYRQDYTNTINGNMTAGFSNETAGVRVFVGYTVHTAITYVTVEKWQDYNAVNGTPGELPVEVIAGTCNDRIYFIRLSDGRIIILDGDNSGGADVENFMEDLIFVNGGSAEGIRIAAWFISHPHGDHFKMLEGVALKYANRLQLEQVVWNFPSTEYLTACGCTDANDLDRIFVLPGKFASQPQVIVPHTGMTLEYSGVRFEFLFTHEDIYPDLFANANQVSTVMRMHVGDETVIWTADMENTSSTYLVKKYRNELKCDAVSVGHHGWNGGGILEFYQRCAPTVMIWNNSFANWWPTIENGSVGTKPIYDIETVQRHIWCQAASPDVLVFPIHHDG